MLPTNGLPGEFINNWEKARDELSHYVHFGQSELCIPRTFFISNKKVVNKKSLHFYLNLDILIFVISCLSGFGTAAIFFW